MLQTSPAMEAIRRSRNMVTAETLTDAAADRKAPPEW